MWMIENHIKKIMTPSPSPPPPQIQACKIHTGIFERVRIVKVDFCTPLQISYSVYCHMIC